MEIDFGSEGNGASSSFWQSFVDGIYYDAASVLVGANSLYNHDDIFEIQGTTAGATAIYGFNGTAAQFISTDANHSSTYSFSTAGCDLIAQNIVTNSYTEYNQGESSMQWIAFDGLGLFNSVINFYPSSWIAEMSDGAATNVISLLPDRLSSQKLIATDATIQTNAGNQWDIGASITGAPPGVVDLTSYVQLRIDGISVKLAVLN